MKDALPFTASPVHDKKLGGANRQAYTVGWICALKTEYVAACELLDEEYPPLPTVSWHDSNVYTLGRIGDHNVVVACHPNDRYGIASAATVAKDMLRSFESVRIGLIVGIGGGAPSQKNDIRLGDVVIGCPTMGRKGGVLPYDFYKAVRGEFEITGSLNIPPPILLTTLNRLEMLHERKGHRIAETVRTMVRKNPRVRKRYQYPGQEKDRWYESSYSHIDPCVNWDSGCNRSVPPIIQRKQRPFSPEEPVVHYGIIASAHQLMNDAVIRDRMSEQHEIACFEMEAAGSSYAIPCVVIRGICDYSDSHNDDEWHGYAAATAASYARELLQTMSGSGVTEHIRVLDQVSKAGMSIILSSPNIGVRNLSSQNP